MKITNVLIHAYRGIPEVSAWSHYPKFDKRWAVCGYVAPSGILPLSALEVPETGIWATTHVDRVNCAFCLDLIENTQKRQTLIPAGALAVSMAHSCFSGDSRRDL